VRGGTARRFDGVDEAVLSPHFDLTSVPVARPAASPTSARRGSGGRGGRTAAGPASGGRGGGGGAAADRGGGGAAVARSGGDRQASKRAEAEQRQRRHRATKDLRAQVDRVERQLVKAEAEVAELQRQLADPDVYQDNEAVKALVGRHDAAKDRASKLMDDWTAASEALERAQATSD
jgi:ATP-binding cassette subfamily F protein 3